MPHFDRNPVNLCTDAIVFPFYLIHGLGKGGREWVCCRFLSPKVSRDREWDTSIQQTASCHNDSAANKMLRISGGEPRHFSYQTLREPLPIPRQGTVRSKEKWPFPVENTWEPWLLTLLVIKQSTSPSWGGIMRGLQTGPNSQPQPAVTTSPSPTWMSTRDQWRTWTSAAPFLAKGASQICKKKKKDLKEIQNV